MGSRSAGCRDRSPTRRRRRQSVGSTVKIRLRDGTGTRDYRFITEDVDRHGNVRLYFRRPGRKKIRLIEKPGTPSFDSEYRRAFAGGPGRIDSGLREGTLPRSGPAPGTMRWLGQPYFVTAASLELDK